MATSPGATPYSPVATTIATMKGSRGERSPSHGSSDSRNANVTKTKRIAKIYGRTLFNRMLLFGGAAPSRSPETGKSSPIRMEIQPSIKWAGVKILPTAIQTQKLR